MRELFRKNHRTKKAVFGPPDRKTGEREITHKMLSGVKFSKKASKVESVRESYAQSNIDNTVDHEPVAKISSSTSNQSAADKFRNKLKSGVKLTSATTQSTLLTAANELQDNNIDDKYMSDMITLKRRLELSKQEGHSPDDVDLNTLIAMEKLNGNNMDNIFYKSILKMQGKSDPSSTVNTSGCNTRAGADEEDDLDVQLSSQSQHKKKKLDTINNSNNNEQSIYDKELKNIIRKQDFQSQLREKCYKCRTIDNSNTTNNNNNNNYILSRGNNSVLRLKDESLSLVSGHFELIPRSHESSSIACSEETLKEFERYKVYYSLSVNLLV